MKPLLCFDLWKTLAWETLSSHDYFRPLFEKYPAVDPDTVSKRVDEVIMCNPVDLTSGMRVILQELTINDKEILDRIVNNWETSCGGAQLFRDTTFVLKELRRDYQLALITNTSLYGWNQLQSKFNLADLFDRIYLSYAVGLVKPDSRIFRKVMADFTLPARQCTMVGDSQESDIDPAKKLDWNTILVKGGVSRELLLRLRNGSES